MASAGTSLLHCDGCGQLASPEHIARRLHRLECATRYRPVHIQALLLGYISPVNDSDFLYSPEGRFEGEARRLLDAVQLSAEGKPADAVLSEFQKRGLMLIHVLECPLSATPSPFEARPILENQLAATVTRTRRSLKPKRVLLISAELASVAGKLLQSDLGCPVFPATGETFLASRESSDSEFRAFRTELVSSYVQSA